MIPLNSYELPDIQRTIDGLIWLATGIGVKYLWNRRVVIKQNLIKLSRWLALPYTIPYLYYGLFKLSKDKEFMAMLEKSKQDSKKKDPTEQTE